jgi:hypothetical protein
MKKSIVIGLSVAIVIFLGIAIYFNWFYQHSCEDMTCFQSYQEKCIKSSVVRETETTTWEYTVKGKESNQCVVEAKVLLVKEGQLDRKSLEGTSMDCSLIVGSKVLPESDLSRCHGILKEEIQQIIITEAHRF